MEVFGMSSEKFNYWEEQKNIKLIEITANQVWGSNVQFSEIKVLNSPYPEFEWPMRLYGNVDVTLEYERSTVGIMIKTGEGYIGLSRMTDEQVFKGLKSCMPENLLHNFQVLDRLLRKRM
jgi:hypothetical protein